MTEKTDWKANKAAKRMTGKRIMVENVAFFAASELIVYEGADEIPAKMDKAVSKPNMALYGLCVENSRPVVLVGWDENEAMRRLISELELSDSDVARDGGVGFVGVNRIMGRQCTYDAWMTDVVKRGIDHERFAQADVGAVAIIYDPSFISYYAAHQPSADSVSDTPDMLRYGWGVDGEASGRRALLDEVLYPDDVGYQAPTWLREVETPEVRLAAHEGCMDALYGEGKGRQVIGGRPVRRNGVKTWFGVCDGCGGDVSVTKGVDFTEGRLFPADTQVMYGVRRSVDRIAARESAYDMSKSFALVGRIFDAIETRVSEPVKVPGASAA